MLRHVYFVFYFTFSDIYFYFGATVVSLDASSRPFLRALASLQLQMRCRHWVIS